MQVQKEDIDWADIVAFVRGDGFLDEWMAKASHNAGKYVLYILDDDLLHVPGELGSGPYYAQKSVQRHIRRVMAYSDCLVSPSQRLRDRYGRYFSSTAPVVEPSLGGVKQKPAHADGKIHIGFAGSSDRGRDVDLILTDALVRIARRYGEKVSISFFGVQTDAARILGCKHYPYTESYDGYRERMKALNWDIGLAPMPDTAFHACKHYNKLVEYCGYGIAGVYSALPPYEDAVEDGVTGLLCENTTDAWAAALSRLIEDKTLRKSISRNCLARAEGEFSIQAAGEQMRQVLSGIALPKTSRRVKGCFGWAKIRGLCSWYLEKFKKYGAKTPLVAIRKAWGQMKKEMGSE